MRWLRSSIALLALACSEPKAPAVAPVEFAGARIESRPCWFEAPTQQKDLRIECAELRVPENWDAPGDREVRIPVVRLRSRHASRWATLIPGGGGPGGSVGLESDEATTTVSNHETIAEESGGDVVIVDQRGAGIAQPAFRCEENREATLHWLQMNPSVDEEAELWADAARRCRRRLEGQVALGAYDAESITRDFEALRNALGYEQWNLFGTSYAGEVALHYAREFPGSIRSLVLDSPSVPGAEVVAPAWFQHALEALFASCAADPRCARDFPEPGRTLDRLLQRFDAQPLTLSVSDPESLAPVPVLITPVRLLDLLFSAMYGVERAHQIPIMLAAAERGSYDWLHEFTRDYVWTLLDPRFSAALLDAVPCRESVPFTDLARTEREADRYPWTRAFVGIERITTAVCRAWNVGRAAESAVKYNGPALLFAGQLDPVIPLPDVERAARSLNGQLVVFPATGHSVVASWWHCLDPVIARFLAHPGEKVDDREVAECRAEADATDFTTLSPPESLSELQAPRSRL